MGEELLSRLELKFSLGGSVDEDALDCGGGDCVAVDVLSMLWCKCKLRGVPIPILISASRFNRLCEVCLDDEDVDRGEYPPCAFGMTPFG